MQRLQSGQTAATPPRRPLGRSDHSFISVDPGHPAFTTHSVQGVSGEYASATTHVEYCAWGIQFSKIEQRFRTLPEQGRYKVRLIVIGRIAAYLSGGVIGHDTSSLVQVDRKYRGWVWVLPGGHQGGYLRRNCRECRTLTS